MNCTLTQIVSPLLFWYDDNARILPWRENPKPYRVWVSEIMLQQTRVEAGKAYFERFMAELPDIDSLARISEERLLKLWEGLGYYNRARNLKKAAQIIMEDHDGCLPTSYEELLSLPGIGEYTAGAIGSIAFGLPIPCVDGNVMRVYTRICADDRNISETKVKKMITEEIRSIVPKDRPGDFNQSLMELGATVCLPNGAPRCDYCPISFCCTSFRENTMLSFPVKSVKKSRTSVDKTVYIILQDNMVALRKRKKTGLLAGLFEFPNVDELLSSEESVDLLKKWNLSIESIQEIKETKHIFSHVEWHMKGYLIYCCGVAIDDFIWTDRLQLEKEIALPSAFSHFLAVALNFLT